MFFCKIIKIGVLGEFNCILFIVVNFLVFFFNLILFGFVFKILEKIGELNVCFFLIIIKE